MGLFETQRYVGEGGEGILIVTLALDTEVAQVNCLGEGDFEWLLLFGSEAYPDGLPWGVCAEFSANFQIVAAVSGEVGEEFDGAKGSDRLQVQLDPGWEI